MRAQILRIARPRGKGLQGAHSGLPVRQRYRLGCNGRHICRPQTVDKPNGMIAAFRLLCRERS